jgi:hypothetical protein
MEPVGLIPPLLGAPVVDAAGGPAGTVADLLADPSTGRPVWAVVRLPDGATVTIPHAIMRSHARALALPCGADHVAAAPPADQAAALCRHFDVAPWELPHPDGLRGLAAAPAAPAATAAPVAAAA